MDRACVVVVGDIGRSPRMQYHALSLANQANLEVDLVGIAGSACWDEVQEHHSITTHAIQKIVVPSFLDDMWLVGKIYKVFVQFLYWLCYLLFIVPRPNYILVQTPPAVPILFIVWVVSWLRWSKLVIDWHNYGYTILNLNQNANKYLVWIYRKFEKFFGRQSQDNFCVSSGMQNDLLVNWGIHAHVLYDRPPDHFRASTIDEMHELFTKYDFGLDTSVRTDLSKETAFTYIDDNLDVQLKTNRPVLIVSSTSWTEDEDFGVLLNALIELNNLTGDDSSFPEIRLVVTGDGDMRSHYEELFTQHNFPKIDLFTVFLPYPDYITLLGCSDLGICLHYSSSEYDLPMKVVDMFGCGLPVCAINYMCLPELVQHKVNGLIFEDYNGLCNQIMV
eukprot:TRINITY_DN1681_c0_g1_i3.p1 TRINITY_DN1681_c0_g1~~TRINITY_DN1681_c0_g1_i3.p1  ORF type:complete len:390 (+),score=52.89 TRINITY_DN1681_c0_g1_i3:91-1260(+)